MSAIVRCRREVTLPQRQFATALSGDTRAVFLAGAPGIGKTPLLQHVAELTSENSVEDLFHPAMVRLSISRA